MRIDFVHLKNYRQYINEKIQFGTDENDKNFTIIQGPMGAGKSNLLNAITWCLYGVEIHLKNELEGLPIFNTEVFDALKKNEILEVNIEIQMIDKEGAKHTFIRSIQYRKNKEGQEELVPDHSSREKDGSKFQYFRQEGNQVKKLDDPRFFLDQMLPEDIKEYFFFDGERLNQYFKESTGEKIKQAVFDISQITIIEKTIKRLITKKRELLQDAGNLGPEIEGLNEQIGIIQKSLDEYKEELRNKKWDKSKAEELERNISEELKQFPDSAGYETSRIDVKGKIEKNEENLNFCKEEKLQKLLKSSYSILALDALTYTKKLIDGGITDGKYPPAARKDFIEFLLKNNTCVCGTSLSDKHCKKKIEDLLKRVSTASDICSEIMNLQGTLRVLIDQVNAFDEEQLRLSKKIKELDSEGDGLHKQQEVLMKQLGSSPIERIKKLKENLEAAQKKSKDLNYDIGKMESKIEDTEKLIKQLNEKLTSSLRKQDKFRVISRTAQFLDKSIEFAEQIRNEIMQEVREKIEEKTKDQFLSLIWNPDAFKDVKIDEKYNISVIHLSGREGIGTLSAGQRQVLALSFMAALKQVSGFDMPILIDTPLGRISKEPKNNIARKLPTYLKGCQVTMLVTEEEYTSEVRGLLKGRVQKEYRIVLERPTSAKVVNYGK